MVCNAIWGVFLFEELQSKKFITLLYDIGFYGLKEIQDWIKADKNKVDQYDIQNVYWSGK